MTFEPEIEFQLDGKMFGKNGKTQVHLNQIHQKPLSSKTTFIKDHFHLKPISSETTSHPSKNNTDRVCVKVSRAEGRDAFTRTRLMPTFGVSAGLSAEHCRPKAPVINELFSRQTHHTAHCHLRYTCVNVFFFSNISCHCLHLELVQVLQWSL